MDPQPSSDEMITSILFFFEYVEQNMFIKGKIENIILILNLGNQGMSKLPVSKLTAVIGAVMNQRKCATRTIFVLNAPFAITLLWKAIKYFIDENTQRKVQIQSDAISANLLALVAPNQLEEKFGGTAPNKTDG